MPSNGDWAIVDEGGVEISGRAPVVEEKRKERTTNRVLSAKPPSKLSHIVGFYGCSCIEFCLRSTHSHPDQKRGRNVGVTRLWAHLVLKRHPLVYKPMPLVF